MDIIQAEKDYARQKRLHEVARKLDALARAAADVTLIANVSYSVTEDAEVSEKARGAARRAAWWACKALDEVCAHMKEIGYECECGADGDVSWKPHALYLINTAEEYRANAYERKAYTERWKRVEED